MIYRTLHTYILRELLRVFLMTASALTTLMAFGGTFRPLTKQGIDVRQLLVFVMNMMPAMMAYAIPIAALFAAVLVYWRMSTDNELTACRAGGVSFTSMVLPAFILGLAVASVDLVFVNYVVPRFLQATERAVRKDLGSLIVSQIGRQEKFQMEGLPLVVTADEAILQPSDDPNISVVVLHGMAAAVVDKQGRPTYMAVAQEAEVLIRNLPLKDAAEVSIKVSNSMAFDPGNAFKKYEISLDSMALTGKPFPVPSILRTKPKFLNLKDLTSIRANPVLFPPVAEATDRIESALDYEQISQNVRDWWESNGHKGTFQQLAMGGTEQNQIVFSAAKAIVNPTGPAQESLSFTGTGTAGTAGGVKVQQMAKGVLATTYTADAMDVVLSDDQITGSGVSASLRLRGNVMLENHAQGLKAMPVKTTMLSGLLLDPALQKVRTWEDKDKGDLVALAQASGRKEIKEMGDAARDRVTKLDQTIVSELHSRGSFSLSCLTLVLFGAALGILLRGKNPLAVFVLGFVPAVLLMLLITAGRQLTEGNVRNVNAGIAMIWAGNVVLLLLVAGVYTKLLRR